MPKPVRRRRRNREEIAALLSEFDRSGQSASVFARRRGLAVSTLHAWRRRRGAFPAIGAPGSARLVPVTIGPGLVPADPVVLEVLLAGGRVLRFPPDLPAHDLAAVCEALERACSR